MNPITNSPIKEEMRRRNEAQAAGKEIQINNQLNNDCLAVQNDAANRIRSIVYKKLPTLTMFLILAIAGGVLLSSFGFAGFLIGFALGTGGYAFWVYTIKKYNRSLYANKESIQREADNRLQQLKNNAANQIRAAYAEADRRTQQEIDQYDTEVKRNCQLILKKQDVFKAMVDHVVNMFQRMVSHADSASNRKFVETDFTYKVELYGICYKYQSTYSNPKDDFNFDKERYRNLTTKEECEGLAQAIARMVMSQMKNLYPPNSLTLSIEHTDAEVTLHFKAANKNYVPPRDIY